VPVVAGEARQGHLLLTYADRQLARDTAWEIVLYVRRKKKKKRRRKRRRKIRKKERKKNE
jgi:hypothetical protein